MNTDPSGNILVVDEEVDFRNVLVETLGSQGYQATGVNSSVEALASLRAQPFDVVVMSLMTMEESGLKLVQEALKLDPHLVCIVMTKADTVPTALEAIQAGAFDYVLKPFRPQTLSPKLARAMNFRNLRLENLHLQETAASHREGATEAAIHHSELDKQSRQSQNMEAIGRLAGSVAHDFNNLLTAINGYSSLALQRVNPDDRLRGYLEEIRKAGERAASLTRQLLACGQKQLLKPVVLNLNEVVSEVNTRLRDTLGDNIRFVAQLDPELKPIKADPGQIEQVLVNLVHNSREAMPQGGTLTIETANFESDAAFAHTRLNLSPGPYVMLAVNDEGCGMDDRTRERIFEPFFTTKEKGTGTGLGLSTVYGIVQQSGGSVWVESEPGKGSIFRIYFPQLQGETSVFNPAGTADTREDARR